MNNAEQVAAMDAVLSAELLQKQRREKGALRKRISRAGILATGDDSEAHTQTSRRNVEKVVKSIAAESARKKELEESQHLSAEHEVMQGQKLDGFTLEK